MITPAQSAFARITENNQFIDLMIDNLVNHACRIDDQLPRDDRKELHKTTLLLFLSSLALSERDDEESD